MMDLADFRRIEPDNLQGDAPECWVDSADHRVGTRAPSYG